MVDLADLKEKIQTYVSINGPCRRDDMIGLLGDDDNVQAIKDLIDELQDEGGVDILLEVPEEPEDNSSSD